MRFRIFRLDATRRSHCRDNIFRFSTGPKNICPTPGYQYSKTPKTLIFSRLFSVSAKRRGSEFHNNFGNYEIYSTKYDLKG